MRRVICRLCFLLFFIVVVHVAANAARLATVKPLPLAFEPTASDPLAFLARGDGYAIGIGADSVTLWLGPHRPGIGWRLDGVRSDVHADCTDVLPEHVNYLIGSDPAKWRVNIPTYGRITYRGVYAGIDEVFYGRERELEHDYVIAPMADASRIRLHIIAPNAVLEATGEIVVRDGTQEFRLRQPKAYQTDERGLRREVAVAYARHSDGTYGFKLGSYDRSRPLTIDPVLTYSTYVGGSAGDNGTAIAVDTQGSAYITGLTFSADFPVTSGVVQSACKSCTPSIYKPDIFVSKLNPTGTALDYSTYVGGSDYDQPFSISVDANGNAVVGGSTSSIDFPLVNNNSTWGTLTSTGPQTHGFVFSLNATGTAFNFSTYIAGSRSETVAGVATDAAGNIFALGSTGSPNFPMTAGTLTATAPAYPISDIFLMKLTPAGALMFSALISPTQQSTSPWANSTEWLLANLCTGALLLGLSVLVLRLTIEKGFEALLQSVVQRCTIGSAVELFLQI